VIRGEDVGGIARFILVYDTDGGPQYRTITGDDVRKEAEAELLKPPRKVGDRLYGRF
jgi:hypothetical protein